MMVATQQSPLLRSFWWRSSFDKNKKQPIESAALLQTLGSEEIWFCFLSHLPRGLLFTVTAFGLFPKWTCEIYAMDVKLSVWHVRLAQKCKKKSNYVKILFSCFHSTSFITGYDYWMIGNYWAQDYDHIEKHPIKPMALCGLRSSQLIARSICKVYQRQVHLNKNVSRVENKK